MMPEPTQAFISYSHKDTEWKDRLLTMLKPLERRGLNSLSGYLRCQSWGANRPAP